MKDIISELLMIPILIVGFIVGIISILTYK